MQQTLLYIPNQVFGVPLFGFGWLLGLWAIVGVGTLVYLVRRQGWNNETLGYLPMLALAGAAIMWIFPALADPHGIPIRGYGVMVLLGVISGVALAVYRGRQRNIDPELIFSLSLWMFVAGILGARLFYVIEFWNPQFVKSTVMETVGAVINIAQGGLVVNGALIGAGIAATLFFRKFRLPALPLADLIAPSMVLGLALGRIGCLLNGCCFGGLCQQSWAPAVTFPYGSPVYQQQVERGQLAVHGIRFEGQGDAPPVVAGVEAGSQAEQAGLKAGDHVTAIGVGETILEKDDAGQKHEKQVVRQQPVETVVQAQGMLLRLYGEGTQLSINIEGQAAPVHWTLAAAAPRSLPVHPTQIYAALDALLLCLFLLAYHPFRRYDGEIVALMLIIYGVLRFVEESLRIDEPKMYWGLSHAQAISIGLVAGGAGLWLYVSRRPRLVHRTAEVG